MKSIDAFVKEQKNSPSKFKTIDNFVRDTFVEKKTTEYKSATANKNQFATDNLAQSPTIKRIDALPSAKPKPSFVEQAKKNGSDYLDSVKKVTAPVVNVAGKGLAAVGKAYDKVSHLPVINQATGAMQGLIEPLVHSNAPTKDEPLWKKYLGNVADTYNVAQNIINPATLITGNLIPSKSDKSVIEKGKALLQAPKSAIQGAINPDEARKRMEESLQSRSLVDKLVIGSAADPLSYVPLPSVRGIKTASSAVGDAFERFAARNKEAPIDFEQYLQASKNRNEISLGQIDRGEQGIVDKFNYLESQTGKNAPLQLNPSRAEVRQNAAQARSTLQPNTTPILGRGTVETMTLPASNTPRIVNDIKKQADALIKPPTSRRGLITYAEQHLEVPNAELVRMNDKDLYELGQMIRSSTNMESVQAKLAAEQGHNWAELVSGKSVTGNVESPLNRLQFKPVTERPKPLIGSGGPVGEVVTKTPKAKPRKTIDEFVNGNKEVAATTVKPKVVPIARVEPVVVKPPTVKPKVEVVQTPGIRANYANQVKNGNLSREFKERVSKTDKSYEKVTNEESLKKANEAVQEITIAESKFHGTKEYSAEHVATGYRLIQELDRKAAVETNSALKEAYHQRSINVANKLAKDLTGAGQTVQAANLLARLSPEGQLLNLTRQAEKNGKVVSVADKVKFQELATEVQKKSAAGVQANQFTEILDRAAKGEKLTPDDISKMSNYLANAEKTIKPKAVKVADDLPAEFKEPRKRDKIISYLDDAEQKALARIAARKNNLNSLPIGEWADHAIVVSAQIAKGSIKAATHVEDLVKMFGEEIRPVATQVFQKAQSLIKRVSPTVGEGNLTKANEAFRRLSGAAEKEKAAVQEMALHVKKIIADSKAGKLEAADIQKLRDYSDEIAEMTADAKVRELPTQDQRFLQSVKSLSKKIAQVETEKIPMDQANKEISNLLRQVTRVIEEGDHTIIKGAPDKELGKALSNIAYDVMSKTKPGKQEKILEKYLRENKNVSPKDIDTLRDLAKSITRLSSDSRIEADIAMQKILNSYEKSGVWDKVTAIRYMAMLLNTGTQLVNAASGPLMATTGHVADVFGTMVDIAMHTTLKTPRTTTLYGTNPIKFIARYFKNLKVGGAAGFHGVNPAGIQSTNEIRGLAYKGAYNPLSWGERTLGAVAKGADYATYKSVYDSEIAKQGFLDAINSGIKRSDKTAIKSHVQKFVNEPTEAAMLNADRIGKNTTFQRSDSLGGETANALNSFKGKVGVYVKPVVNVVVPFVRTPINIASTAVTLTPAGVLKGLFQLTSMSKATQREAIRSLSLGLTGSAGIGTIGYYLSQLGIITGSNDSGDKDVDAIREQAGLGKYRFNQSALKRYLSALLDGEGSEAAEKAAKYKEGDHAFDYNKFQPLAFPMAIGASLGKSQGKPLLGRLETAGGDAYGSLFGMSTLKSVQSIFQPTYGGTQGEKALGPLKRVEEAFLKSFSWGGLAQEARRQDPIVRKTPFNDGVIANTKAYFQSRIPFGVSESLPASKTTLGMDKMNAPGVMGQYVNPYKSEVAAYSQAAVIISELIDRTGDFSVAPSAPAKTVEVRNKAGEMVKINIPPDRYEQLQEEVGHNIIIKIMALNPNLSDLKKVEKIKDIYEKVRKKEMDKVEKELKHTVN